MANKQSATIEQLAARLGRMDVNQLMAHNEKALLKKGLKKKDAVAPTVAPGTLGNQDSVWTNVYPVRVPDGIKVFYYKIKVEVGVKPKSCVDQRWFDITADRKHEVDARNLMRMAYDVVQHVVATNHDVFLDPKKVAYDGKNNLYAFGQQLEIRDGDVTILEIEAEDDFKPMRRPYKSAKVTIETLRRFSNLSDANDPYVQAMILSLDALTSQGFMKSLDHAFSAPQTAYLFEPRKYGFDAKDLSLPAQSEVGIGGHKTCKFVSANGKPVLGAVLKAKKSPFYVKMCIIDKVLSAWPDIVDNPFGYMDGLNDMLTGLVMEGKHCNLAWPLQIKCVIRESAAEKCFTMPDNSLVSVQDYYKNQYGITLQYPQLPLIEVGARGKESSFHPMELYYICAAQRVKNRHLHYLTADLIKACALLPRDVQNQLSSVRNLFCFDANDQMRDLGISIDETPAKAPARRIAAPGISYRGRMQTVDPAQSTWKGGPYVLPRNEVRWALYSVQERPVLQQQGLIQFGRQFLEALQGKGVNIGEPGECVSHRYEGNETFEKLIKRAKNGKCDMVMFVTQKTLKIQDTIKQWEQTLDIITQNVTVDTAQNAAGIRGPPRRLTMENIANKFNVKLGGLNYRVIDSLQRKTVGENDLFVGITLGRPSIGMYEAREYMTNFDMDGAPNVVAFMANDLADSLAFTGDYIYQHPKMQEVNIENVERIVRETVGRYVKNRGRKPQNVWIFRYGVNEGMYDVVSRYILMFWSLF
uniref:Piwi domain-containing protein n=1 Tax=Bursaphelenchus xylophilus TaxID=6326 RepID=A0A1I7SQZ4_BURXY